MALCFYGQGWMTKESGFFLGLQSTVLLRQSTGGIAFVKTSLFVCCSCCCLLICWCCYCYLFFVVLLLFAIIILMTLPLKAVRTHFFFGGVCLCAYVFFIENLQGVIGNVNQGQMHGAAAVTSQDKNISSQPTNHDKLVA